MKSGLCITAVASLLLAEVSAARAADREVDRVACDSRGVTACTTMIGNTGKTVSIRSIAHRNRETTDIGDNNLARRCPAVATGSGSGRRVYRSGVATRNAEARKAACDRFAGLPSHIVPDESPRCRVGLRVDVSGTLLDIKRDGKTWSVGTTTHIDTCTGLVDPSTGFAVLFGSNDSLPPSCGAGRRFVASGDIDYGFRPEFFLKVRSIACE
jgi:hypothetical protein